MSRSRGWALAASQQRAAEWEPVWLPGRDGPVHACVTGPEAPASQGAVLLAPLAYEYWTTFATLRDLAWALADRGVRSVRFDYEGTGDSAGEPWDPNLFDAWRADLRAAVAHLRSSGCSTVTLIGVRFSAALALADAASLGADAVVAIAPVPSGKRFVRELSLLGHRVPEDDPRHGRAGALISGGLPFPDDTIEGLRSLELSALTAAPAPRVLLVQPPSAKPELAEHLSRLGVDVDVVEEASLAQVLEVTTEKAQVPALLVADVASWVVAKVSGSHGDSHSDRHEPLPRRGREGVASAISWGDRAVCERVVLLGSTSLAAVRGDPLELPTAPEVAVVFLNTGAEHHVGPGRAWVEYARHLNTHGWTTFRLDFTGWGESVLGQPPAGRPYAASAVVDAQRAAAALRELGFRRVVLVGLCSSAWTALRAALGPGIDAVYALNPQLYWQPGDPDDFTVEEAAVYRARRARVEAMGHRYGVWQVFDRLGLRSRAGRWLDKLGREGRTVRLAFAEGDIGHDFLIQRVGRRVEVHRERGRISCVVLPDIDHQMHREWLRAEVARDLTTWLAALAPAPVGADLRTSAHEPPG